jgi:hypothetical protein
MGADVARARQAKGKARLDHGDLLKEDQASASTAEISSPGRALATLSSKPAASRRGRRQAVD